MKLRIAVTRAVVVALVFVAGCGGAQSRYHSHMAKGEDFFAAENFEKARIEFRNALQILPNDAQGRFMFGRSMERLGKIREAAGMYQGAIDTEPEHAGARAALGRIYVFGGAPDKALELVEPAIALHPEDAELLTVRAAARSQLNQPEPALADAERAVQLAPANENAVALLASLYRLHDQAPRAIELLNATLAKTPKATELRQVLALLYLSVGDKQGAEAQMRKVIESRPTDPKPRYQLAIFLSGEKRLDDAQKVLEEAIAAAARRDDDAQAASDEAKLVYADFLAGQREPARGVVALEKFMRESPENYDLALGLGALRQRMNDNAAAVAVYEKVIADAGKKPPALVARDRIAAIHVAAGRIAPAKELIAQVLAENPRDNDALLLRGNLALQANDPATAIGALRAVLRDQPDAVAVLRTLARAHAANGESALAEESLQRAVQLTPQDAGVRVELAQFLAHSGKSEQALPLIEQTVRDNPTNVGAREVLVRMYIERRDIAAAKLAADDLKTLAPERAVGYYLAGLVAQAQKRSDDARAGFERALELQPDAADALAALMRLHLSMNRTDEARALVERTLARTPDNFVARNLLGELHLAAKELQPARAEFSKVVASAPSWTLGYRNLALAYMAGNDDRSAIATLEKGIAASGQDFSLVADLAALYERGRRFDQAIAAYEALVEHRHGVAAAENNLAMLLVTYRTDQKSFDRARELTQQFADSPNPALLDTHGWVLYRRGQFAEALTVLERARQIAPDAPAVRFHLGMAQYKSGLSAQARENLQAALASPRVFAGADEARAALAAMGPTTGPATGPTTGPTMGKG